MSDPLSNLPAVFIAEHNAQQLSDALVDALGPQLSIGLATSLSEVTTNYAGEPVVLGRPDFVAELMKIHPPVEWVQSSWAGVAPLLAIENQDYQLTGVKDVFGPQMAEYVMAYVLAHEIKVLQRLQSQQRRHWDQRPSGSLKDKVFGVMGTGSIGRYVAQTALQFAMKPIGFNANGRPVAPFEQVYGGDSLTEFLSHCDYLLAVLPDTPATSNLLNEQAFVTLKETAYLINVGRGNVIDEEALRLALIEQRLAGAVLDVFREEPVPESSPLWEVPNLLLTGHVAAISKASDIARLFIENYRLFSSGQRLRHLVDFTRRY